MAQTDAKAKRPKIQLPAGYADEAAFLHEMRDELAKDQLFDHENREAGVEDLKFLVGEQWDARIRAHRESKRKPVLTINRLPAFVAQVIGARLENETQIKVLPDNGGTKAVATVREGLIRNIQKVSKADFAYDNALIGSVTCGIGNFQVERDYESDDSWEQSLRIAYISDHFAVVWDRSMTEPTGQDAKRAFLLERMTKADFEAEYPWATPTDVISDRMPAEVMHSAWYQNGDVQIANYWRIRERKRTIALMQDGATVDITDIDDPAVIARISQRPDGSPMIREVYRKYAQMYRCSGADVLEGPFDLPITRIPIFRVPGWELRIGDTVHRWGLIRHMKDPQRLHNYWRSAIAERIMQSPKNTWMSSAEAVAGREKAWRASANSDDPLLIYNGEAGQPPERVPPIQVEGALIQQAEMTAQDLKDVSNIHEANLGMPSNEVSGAAIKARVRVSDTGTMIYRNNLTKAIEEAGRVINELIPIVYDTARVVKVIGEDAKELMQAINDTTKAGAVDITTGKYAVTVSTGPSYATKRQETADSIMSLATAMPQVLSLAADLIIEAQDWPDAEKIAQRIRMSLPPELLTPDEMTPAVAASAQARSQQQNAQTQAAMQKMMADFLKTQSQAALDFARARNYTVQADAVPSKVMNESLRTASEAASRELHDHLDAINVAHG